MSAAGWYAVEWVLAWSWASVEWRADRIAVISAMDRTFGPSG